VVEKSRRPQHSPTRTPTEMEQRVLALRQQRPEWGARKLQVLLKGEGLVLPTITIHRILLRHNLVRPQDRHRAAVQRFSRSAPNQLWQMDFKGPRGWQAPVGPLSIVDDHSGYAITLQGTWSSKAQPVKAGLEEAFQRCGMPERDADGSRDAVVEHEIGNGVDVANGVDGEAGDPRALQRIPAPADTRQSGTLSWLAGSGDAASWLALGSSSTAVAG
jgi:hypothetical protein